MSAPRPPASTDAKDNIPTAKEAAVKGASGSKPVVKGKSTKDIFKDLTAQQYLDKSDKLISRDDPLFVSMVLLDVKAARLRNNNNNIMQTDYGSVSAGDVNTLLQTLGLSKETVAHQSTYSASVQPLIHNASQFTTEKEGLENDIRTYITELHSKIRTIIKEKEEGKPASQVRNAMDALTQAETNLTTRVKNLGKNSDALQKQLDKIYHEMFGLLPHDARKNLRDPTARAPEKAGTAPGSKS